MQNDRQGVCSNYYNLTFGCYIQNYESATRMVNNEVDGYKKLMKHLMVNKSDIPRRLQANGNVNYFNLLFVDIEENRIIKESPAVDHKYDIKKALEENKKYFKN